MWPELTGLGRELCRLRLQCHAHFFIMESRNLWVPGLVHAISNFPKLLKRVDGVALGLRLLKPAWEPAHCGRKLEEMPSHG